MEKKLQKQATQLLELFKEFQITDLIGFGSLLGVEEKENFIEYTTEILVKFCGEGRIKRRQLLKLAKDIAVANKYMVAETKEENNQNSVPAAENLKQNNGAAATPGDIQGEK